MFKVTFSNKGAVVKSWILKDYENAKQDGELDLVHRAGAEGHGYPFEVDLRAAVRCRNSTMPFS